MATITVKPEVIDPLKWQQMLWPDVHFYDKQRQVIYSVVNNDETVVPAGNMLGKDFVSGFIALYFFISRNPVRIITTSVKDDHLRVLWGEINRYISTAKQPLRSTEGGPLVCNHQDIKKIVYGKLDDLSYLRGMVASDGAAMQGHHIAQTGDGIPRTLFLVDEASGVMDEYYTMASTWANRILIIGNPWECNNFFKHAVKGKPGTDDKGGDIPRDGTPGYYRKIIKIAGMDSPNVRYGLKEKAMGLKMSNRFLFPGVLSYAEYVKRRKLFDKIKQTVSIDGEFYEGSENMMFPPDWLNRAELLAQTLPRMRRGRAIGCDPAEGGDSSCWSVVDENGLIHLLSLKTPDTSVIPTTTIRLMKEYHVSPEDVWFDRGGGGKQHVDRLRTMGYSVKTVAFGEAASEANRFAKFKSRGAQFKQEELEDRTVYKNRRAEMYGIIRELIDPINDGFALPVQYYELRRQLAPIPLRYEEGKMLLLPKSKAKPDSKEDTLKDLLGCSPDEADSLALAVFGLMEASVPKLVIGAIDV